MKNTNLPDFSLSDLQTGGTCSLLEVIDVFTNWCSKDRELLASFIPTLLPDIPKDIKGNEKAEKQFLLDFSLIKICHKASKLGKTVKYIYEQLDEDNDGSLDKEEIFNGLKDKFNIFFGDYEAENLSQYLDGEGSGGIKEKSRLNYLWQNYAQE